MHTKTATTPTKMHRSKWRLRRNIEKELGFLIMYKFWFSKLETLLLVLPSYGRQYIRIHNFKFRRSRDRGM